MTNPSARVITALETHGCNPKPAGQDKWESICPVHRGERRNLSVTRENDGKILPYCHAHQCDTSEIVETIGLTMADLFPSTDNGHTSNGKARKPARAKAEDCYPGRKVVARWDYHHADGGLLFCVLRFEPKDFRPAYRDADGWRAGDPPGSLPLYRLPDLAGASRIVVCEGEKAADAIRAIGLSATTSAHGANSASKSDWRALAGKDVCIIPDNDGPGEGYASAVVRELSIIEPRPTVRIARLPGLWAADAPIEKGADAVELLRDGLPSDWTDEQKRSHLERVFGQITPERLTDHDEATGDDWPALRLAKSPLPTPFPIHVLPEPVRRIALEVAESIGTSVDFAASQALAIASGVIGNTTTLLLKPGYFARAPLFLSCVGPISDGKTPALILMRAPVTEIDRRLEADYAARLEDWKETATKVGGKRNKPEGAPPVPSRVDVDNFTIEKLLEILAANERGLIAFADELAGLFGILNQYRPQ